MEEGRAYLGGIVKQRAHVAKIFIFPYFIFNSRGLIKKKEATCQNLSDQNLILQPAWAYICFFFKWAVIWGEMLFHILYT